MGEKTQILKDRAAKFAKKGQTKRAIKEYEKLLEHAPGDARTLHRLAELWAREKATTKAVDLFLQAADGYSKAGFSDRALAVLKQALSLDAARLDANLRLAEQYASKEFGRDAVYHLIKAARVYEKAGRDREQLQVLQKAVELAPGDVDGHMHLARLLVKTGRQDEARKEFLHAASELEKAGRVEEFITVAEKALSAGETNLELHHSLAQCYLNRKDYQQALVVADRQMQLRSDDLKSLQLKAEAHLGLQQTAKAASTYKRLVRLARLKGHELVAQASRARLQEIAPGSMTGEFPAPSLPGGAPPPPPLPVAESLDDDSFEDEDTASFDQPFEPPDLTVDEPETWDDQTTPYSIQPDEQTLVAAIDDILAQAGELALRPACEDGEPDEEFEDTLKEADFYIGMGLLDEAEEALQGLAERHPRHPEIVDRLGEILRLRGIEFDDTESMP